MIEVLIEVALIQPLWHQLKKAKRNLEIGFAPEPDSLSNVDLDETDDKLQSLSQEYADDSY